MGETVRVTAMPLERRAVHVEGSGFWGPDQALLVRLERLGYRVEEHRLMASGDVRFDLS